ncbi:hypothetical protein LZG74_25640 [Dyadobacter sp. CY327]|uniref:hypothetical protein n=1 Tax=Dyadobacter sp. CY327 TaxID=2907301 RepID=UPI001F3239CE|nr:hypothetical protein [Dyadobacter sp. CY327]MCE7073717.1 hypothetical protein [Dyadobacter sp. CY327]
MKWILAIYLACNGWGCGQTIKTEYASREECYEALENSKIGPDVKVENNANQHAAICAPSN